jgi:hypothetical protein
MEQRDDSTSDWDFGFDFGAVTEPSDEQTDRGDDVPADDGPIRKGGGPPGRSAFLPGGRLRRLSRDRGAAPVEAPAPVPTAFHPAFDDEGRQIEEQPFRPINEWVFDPDPEWSPDAFSDKRDVPTSAPSYSEPVPDTTSSSTSTFDPFAPFDSPIAEAPTTTEAPRPPAGRTFPGGRAKLPRLNPDSDAEAEVDYVSTAFIPGRSSDEDESGHRTGFHGYNTYESLFADAAIADPLTKPADEDAYAVLGVSREDDWKVVVRAHRQLVKANHPDRLSDAPVAVRQDAEERLRQINLAYREVKEHRREEGRPTSSADSECDDEG